MLIVHTIKEIQVILLPFISIKVDFLNLFCVNSILKINQHFDQVFPISV